jgi:nudix-type nucleoside diphosphatase (YffH/AdpP family)
MHNPVTEVAERLRIKSVELLSDNWAILKKTVMDYRLRDGSWQTLVRETYDRGNGATILLYNREQRTVILTRQFRYPAYVNQHHGMLIETCAGLLDEYEPEEAIRREVEEETGYRITKPQKVFDLFMSPGSVTERLYFFVAEYSVNEKVTEGGGVQSDGELIEVLELDFDEALEMIKRGEIMDGKTVILLQYAQLNGLFS